MWAASEASRRKGLKGGITGVWLSGVLYGVIASIRGPADPVELAYSIVSSVIILLLAYYAWLVRPWRRKLYSAVGALLSIPIAVVGYPESIPLTLLLAVLLVASNVLNGLPLIVAGGAMIGGLGGLIACIGRTSWLAGLLPTVFHSATVSKASIRVSGKKLWLVSVFAIAASLSVIISLVAAGLLGLIIVSIDMLARISELVSGADTRLSLKQYGIVETIRDIVVLSLLGLVVSYG